MNHLMITALVSLAGIAVANSQVESHCADWPNERFFSSAGSGDVRACLSNGQEVNSRDASGRTALHWAAAASNETTVLLELLVAGANPRLTDRAGNRAIHVAASEGKNSLMLAYLIAWGSDAEAEVAGRSGRCPWSTRRCSVVPLHLAAVRPDGTDYIGTLLAAGADPNASDEERRTPLHHAASASLNTRSIRLLLNAGAAVNSADREGETPLHLAVKRRSGDTEEIVSVLLAAGASPDQGDKRNTTPLMWGARSAQSGKVVQMLVEASRQPCAADSQGRTALQQWDQNEHLETDEVYWSLHEQCTN